MIPRDRRLPLALHALGMAVVGYGVLAGRLVDRRGPWVAWTTAVAIVAWAVVQLLPRPARLHRGAPPARRAAILVGVAVASVSTAPTNGVHLAPQAVLLIAAFSDDDEPVWLGVTAALTALVLTPLGAVLSHGSPALSYLAAVAVWVLIGITRRQAGAAVARTRELEARQLEAREQAARAGALASRQAAARDIHDVLAHSLGGLVVQLDAAEALLESGRIGDAQTKVSQARSLAADGLADARRAVAALRTPSEVGDPREGGGPSAAATSDLRDAVERLLRVHRELGGEIAAPLDVSGASVTLPGPVAGAFERALQEALSNARRHAPGAPVAASLVASGGFVTLTVSNTVAPGRRTVARDGHGLAGMVERFAALPGGAAEAGERDGRFVVSASARAAGE